MTTSQKHSQTAREFLAVATREFATGDNMQGSEKLWGAAAHAVIAVAQQRGWSYGSHRALKIATDRMAAEQGEETFRRGFGLAQQFHANFYHDFMEPGDIEKGRPLVNDFVEQVLTLV